MGVLEGGVYYPKGGMLELSKKLADFYIIKGGEIRYKKLVKKILVDDGFVIGVELRDGSQILSDHVISNADVKRTIIEYVGKEHFPEEYISFIKNLKNSVTGIMLFLGLDMNLPNIPSHFQTGMGLDLIEKVHNGDLDFTKLAIRIPTKVDMNLMHNNGHSLIAFIFAPYNWNNYWKSSNDKIRGKEYNDFKNKIGEQMIDQIEKVIPDVRKHIIVKEVATPLTFERYAQVSDGAWFGPFTMQKLPQKETPIKNLYFAGSSTSGSGTSGAMRSGFETARLILDKINGK
ncbi:MAG: NAD(P)/FAD-dependent oxidoreductase [Asgard group archaeon]|nr:NAD(P)/FAD-dependent oxidoreductase [Asgard group archaeon]